MASIISDAKKELAFRVFRNEDRDVGLYAGEIKGSPALVADPDDFYGKISRDNFSIIAPNINPPSSSVLNMSSQLQFRVEAGSCGVIDELWMDFTLNEYGGANSVTPSMVPFIFNNIVVGISSSASLQTLYPEHMYSRLQLLSHTEAQKELYGNALNMTFPTFTGPTAIAAGGSATYSMRLPMLMCRKELDMRASKQPLLITCYFNPNPVVAGTGLLGYVNSQLRIRWRRDDYYDAIRLKMLAKMPMVLSYMQTPITQYTQTLTAGVRQVIPLTSVTGYMGALAIFIRAAASYTTPTGGAIANFLALEGPNPTQGTSAGYIDLLASDSSSYFGAPNILTPTYFRSQAMLSPRSEGSMALTVPFYRLDFSSDFQKGVVESGTATHGGILFDGNQQLVIQPGVGFAASGTSCVITVLPYLYATMLVRDGNWTYIGDGASLK